MASASTEVGPFFATPHHAPIELPEHVLTMIVLLLRVLDIGRCRRKSEIALCRFDGRDRVRLPILATSSEERADGRRAGLVEGSGRS
jgi:hypothetical protein